MAKRGTLTHRKTRWLARALGVPLPYALGIMEALWHTAAEQTPAGDIGHLSNKAIASECYFDGDPDALVRALVEAELLDDDLPGVRLFIHGWHEHAENAVHKFLLSKRMYFANGVKPTMKHDMFEHKVRMRIEAEYRKQELPGLGELPDTSGSNPGGLPYVAGSHLGAIGEESHEDEGLIPAIPLPLPLPLPNTPQDKLGPPAPGSGPGSCPRWWELPDVHPLALEVVQAIQSAEDSRGVRCYRNQDFREADAMRLVAYVEKHAPDLEAFRRDALRPFLAEILKHDGLKYTRAIQRLETWTAKNEPEWARTKRSRAAEQSRQPSKRKRGPLQGEHWEERVDGEFRRVLYDLATGETIDRAWVFAWFAIHDAQADHVEAAAKWCTQNGLPDVGDDFLKAVEEAA